MWPLIKFLRGLKKTFLQRARGTAASKDPLPLSSGGGGGARKKRADRRQTLPGV